MQAIAFQLLLKDSWLLHEMSCFPPGRSYFFMKTIDFFMVIHDFIMGVRNFCPALRVSINMISSQVS